MNETTRTKRHYSFGKRFTPLIKDILPKSLCELALATCRFEIKNFCLRHNFSGTNFKIHMMTHGERLLDIPCKKSGNWIVISSAKNISLFLSRFGLNLNDVIQYVDSISKGCVGWEAITEKKTFDLVDLIEFSAVEYSS